MTDKTTLPPDGFDAFMKRLDEPPKVLPNLAKLLNEKPLWDNDKPLDIVTEPTGDVAEALQDWEVLLAEISRNGTALDNDALEKIYNDPERKLFVDYVINLPEHPPINGGCDMFPIFILLMYLASLISICVGG